MTDEELLQTYVHLAPFLAKVCGPSCEIVVHSTVDPERSLVAIENSLSGRAKGNPLTEFAKGLAEKGMFKDVNYLANYTGKTAERDFLSSTFFIKNGERLVGMLCINKDVSSIKELNCMLASLQEHFNLAIPADSQYSENLDSPVESMMRERIADTIMQSGVIPARMSIGEKVQVVSKLHEIGITTMKGAITEIAKQLSISVPTVYRYIKKADTTES